MAGSEEVVINIIKSSPELLHILKLVRSLDLQQGCVAAGVIRNSVWQSLHFQPITIGSDVDVVFFDEALPQKADVKLEQKLCQLDSRYSWQVKNEVYMNNYDFDGNPRFVSVRDAISNFVEIPTCVGALLNDDNQIELIAPYGVDDLVNLKVRPVPKYVSGKWRKIYDQRISSKNWLEKFPKLTFD